MRRYLIPCAMLLASCGHGEPPAPAVPPPALANATPVVDPALFETCPGWTGGPPVEGLDLILAAEAEIACRRQMGGQLEVLAEIYAVGPR